jgi:hypothetical protein
MDGGGLSTGALRTIGSGDFAPIATSPDTGPAPQLQWLRIADLVVDERYQRPIYGAGRTNVRRIAENFRWSKFAPVIVAPIVGGQYAVIDGQHRATAAALIGIEQVPCQVIIADLQEQAAAFKAVNGQVTRMHNLALQAASLAAGDESARALQDVAEASGVTILRYPKMLTSMLPGETMALGAIADGLKAHGREVVVAALRCVTASKNNQPGVLSGPMIKGLCAAVAGQIEAGDWLFRAFDRIKLVHELDEAQVTRRAKGVAVWEVLAERLKPRVADELAQLGQRPSISRADEEIATTPPGASHGERTPMSEELTVPPSAAADRRAPVRGAAAPARCAACALHDAGGRRPARDPAHPQGGPLQLPGPVDPARSQGNDRHPDPEPAGAGTRDRRRSLGRHEQPGHTLDPGPGGGRMSAVAFLACSASAALAIYRVYDRAVTAAIAYMVEKKVTDVGVKSWAGAWGYMALSLLMAAAAGWIARGL